MYFVVILIHRRAISMNFSPSSSNFKSYFRIFNDHMMILELVKNIQQYYVLMMPYYHGATSKKDLYGHYKIFVSINYITHTIKCAPLYKEIGYRVRVLECKNNNCAWLNKQRISEGCNDRVGKYTILYYYSKMTIFITLRQFYTFVTF